MLEETVIVLDCSTGEVSFVDAVYDPEKEDIEDVVFSEESELHESDCNWMSCNAKQVEQSLNEYMKKEESTEKNKEDKEKVVSEVLDVFNFEKVHKTMVFLDWKWKSGNVPTVEELHEQAEMLVRESLESESMILSTGGFTVVKIPVEKDKVMLELMFNVESAYDVMETSNVS